MASSFIWMNFTLQDLSSDIKIAQFGVQTRKLWHPKAKEEKQRKLLIILTLKSEFSRYSVDMLPRYQ